jgi:dTDP-glucose pyrophosphorylase
VKIKTGVITAAGKGTRIMPITRAIPKEMIIVNGKPFIQYVLENMSRSGIKMIYVVIGWKKHAIMDFLGSGKDFGVDIAYLVQDEPEGLAKAVGTVERFIDEDFMVCLGDDIFYPSACIKDIIDFHFSKKSVATIGVDEVPMSEIHKYGVVDVNKDGEVMNLIEKPKPEDAPSNKVIAGVYIFNPCIFDAIRKTPRGVNNEYQLTDSIKILKDEGKPIYAKKLAGTRITIGSQDELRKANEILMNHNKSL